MLFQALLINHYDIYNKKCIIKFAKGKDAVKFKINYYLLQLKMFKVDFYWLRVKFIIFLLSLIPIISNKAETRAEGVEIQSTILPKKN